MSRLSAGVVTAVLVLACPAVALGNDSAHDKAAASFQEGRRLIEQGNCEAAVTKLQESLQYESSIGARLSIAECVEKEDPLRAWRLLKEAAALSLINHDERISAAEQHATAIQGRLAMILFKLPSASDQAGFDLRIDGEIVDRYFYRSGYASSPGKHVVEASAPGRRFAGTVSVDAGTPSTVEVELRAEDCRDPSRSAPPTTPVLVESDRGSSRRALGIAIGSVGVAGVATGIVFGLLTLDHKRSIEAACGGNVGSCSAAHGSQDAETEAAKTTASLSTVGFVGGAVGLLAGAAVYVTAPASGAAGAGVGVRGANAPPGKAVRLSPRASIHGGGLGIEGSW